MPAPEGHVLQCGAPIQTEHKHASDACPHVAQVTHGAAAVPQPQLLGLQQSACLLVVQLRATSLMWAWCHPGGVQAPWPQVVVVVQVLPVPGHSLPPLHHCTPPHC
jgi:hypothetical protein